MKFLNNKKALYSILINIGAVLLVASAVLNGIIGEDFHRIAGAGLALGVILIGVFSNKRSIYYAQQKHPELYRKRNIEENDERNITIRDKAWAKVNNILVWLIFAVILIFSIFDVELYVSLSLAGLILVNYVLYYIYYSYYNKRL